MKDSIGKIKAGFLGVGLATLVLFNSAPASAQLPGGVGGGLAVPFGIDPSAIGGVGLELVSGFLSADGPSSAPFIGSDLASLTTPDGVQSGITALVLDQELPVAFPVVGRKPQKLYGSVLFALLNTYGIPLGSSARQFNGSLEFASFTDVLADFPIPMP